MHSSEILQVTVASQVSATQAQTPLAVPVKVSIKNPSGSPVTVLKWGTPLDTRAGVLGVFEVCDTTSGKTLPVDTIKISRKLPASPEDLVEIPADETVDHTVYLPGMDLQEGHEYSVRAEGIWHAIWEKPLVDVTGTQLKDLTGAIRGEFRSNIAVMKAERAGHLVTGCLAAKDEEP